MNKATEMARVTAKGSFHMLWGLVISTVISAIGTIFIARLLGADDYGLYTIAIGAPNLIANFRDWGINTAIVKYSAQYNSENKLLKIKSVFAAGLIFEIIVGALLTVIAFILSDFLAVVFQRPHIAPLIQISSLFILSGALGVAASSAFTGLERMHLNSVWYVIQAIFKTALILLLILAGFGTTGAVTGFSLGLFLASLAAVLLMLTIYRSLKQPNGEKLEIFATMKMMLRYGFPLSIAVILTGFLTYFYTYVMAFFVSDAPIGNYSVAQNFVVLITFFAIPVTTMMLPAFSKLNATQDHATLRGVFQYSVKYASMIVLPVSVMVMALAQPAIATIFQDQYPQAPLYLALLAIIYLFTALGSLSAGNLISSQGYTKYSLKLTVLTVAVGFPLSFIFTALLGITGLIVSTLITSLPSLFLALNFIKKRFNVTLDWAASARIAFSSGATGILTYLSVSLLPFSSPIQLIIGVIIFAVAFLFIALITRTITRPDLVNIREIAKALGPLSKILYGIIGLLETIMNKLHL